MSLKRRRTPTFERSAQRRRILGIDPGLARLGWGVVESRGERIDLVRYGCLTTAKGESVGERLFIIHRELRRLLTTLKPDVVAVEELFFSKNVKTAMVVGEARGTVLMTCASVGCPVVEFTPLEVKQALTGFGGAEKQQVQRVVKLRLNLDDIPRPDDAADAIAVAMCAAQSSDQLTANR